MKNLKVVSNVARDLEQASAFFGDPKKAVWEYIANGLEYTEAKIPVVQVILKKSSIDIIDNGRGMSANDLVEYFTLHGENRDRLQGKQGRGRFGTGKIAAFGIANCLEVDTICNKTRRKVRLTRSAIKNSDGKSIPVETIFEGPSNSRNGTKITISKLKMNVKVEEKDLRSFFERHLVRWPRAEVSVNGGICRWKEPPSIESLSFTPPISLGKGVSKLTLKVSPTPLAEELQGVSIFANGVWHETSLVGSQNKPFAHYIFGSIDVSSLDDDHSIPAFDAGRQMKLNASCPLVSEIYRFVGSKIEELRSRLVEEDKKRRAGEVAATLRGDCREIEMLLNGDRSRMFDGGGGGGEKKESSPNPSSSKDGSSSSSPSKPRKPSIRVDVRPLGEKSPRSLFVKDEGIILNSDHPRVDVTRDRKGARVALKTSLEETAVIEYALATVEEEINQGRILDHYTALAEVRSVIERIMRKSR